MNKLILVIMLIVHSFCLSAQIAATNSNGAVKTTQPKIMVIPRVNEGQDIRTILDQNEPLRVAITQMKNYFDTRGYRTDDFMARLKSAINKGVFTSDNQTEMATELVRMSDADIYVVLDVTLIDCSNGKIARINMDAYYTATAVSIGSIVASSPCNRAEYGMLIQKAIDDYADLFLNKMQANFNDFVDNGVPVYMEIGFTTTSNYSMSTPVGADKYELSDAIDLWLEKSAYKGQYNVQSTIPTLMIVSDVRIPIRNQATNANYSPKRFALDFSIFLKSLGLDVVKKDVGSNLFFTIN